MKLGEWLSEDVIGDLVVIDVEPLEDGLVENAPILLAGLSVHLLGVAKQLERRIDERGADLESVVGPFELFFELRSLSSDAA